MLKHESPRRANIVVKLKQPYIQFLPKDIEQFHKVLKVLIVIFILPYKLKLVLRERKFLDNFIVFSYNLAIYKTLFRQLVSLFYEIGEFHELCCNITFNIS